MNSSNVWILNGWLRSEELEVVEEDVELLHVNKVHHFLELLFDVVLISLFHHLLELHLVGRHDDLVVFLNEDRSEVLRVGRLVDGVEAVLESLLSLRAKDDEGGGVADVLAEALPLVLLLGRDGVLHILEDVDAVDDEVLGNVPGERPRVREDGDDLGELGDVVLEVLAVDDGRLNLLGK